MPYFITTLGTAVQELYCDQPGYAEVPPDAVQISDTEADVLRKGRFSDYTFVGGVLKYSQGATHTQPTQTEILQQALLGKGVITAGELLTAESKLKVPK